MDRLDMSYIQKNKEAWEEAFTHRKPNWGEDNHLRLQGEELSFFEADVQTVLKTIDFRGKAVAQFCCNNGRELLSLMRLGAASGHGFDIAENILVQARETADKAGILNCTFVAGNVLEISKEFENAFDFIFFTIGAITWIRELPLLFQKAASCLKPGGVLLLHDYHPFMNMLPIPGEEDFDPTQLNRLSYPYFKDTPWVENTGMNYMSETYASKDFTSFAHTLTDIIGGVLDAGLRLTRLREFDYNVGLTDVYNGKGYPLSFLVTAEKSEA